MIASSIYANDRVSNYPLKLQKAIAYLKEHDFSRMEPGVYEIEGRELFAQVVDAVTGSLEEKRPEAHREYIDVHFLVTGSEQLGFVPDTGEYRIAEDLKEKDLIFYESVEKESFIHARPGSYTIFFPNDIHRPAVMEEKPGTIRKVIMKVKAE